MPKSWKNLFQGALRSNFAKKSVSEDGVLRFGLHVLLLMGISIMDGYEKICRGLNESL